MANPEHLAIIKRGATAWNQWREDNPGVRPDLTQADLFGAELTGANLVGANLVGADLMAADLRGAELIEVKLTGANLVGADLVGANLVGADLDGALLVVANFEGANLAGAKLTDAKLTEAKLTGANLVEADLSKADLAEARLIEADLFGANLGGADLMAANLAGADMTKAFLGYTSLGDLDLSQVKGLETVRHGGPSSIGIDTIFKSGGNIPEAFLRGAGVPEDFIKYIPSFVNKAIEYYSLFISYSHKDDGFARRLHADLQAANVRCWFAPHDMAIGDKIRDRIDESIRVYDKLLLILSHDSIFSNWVEKEVETAFEKEERQGKLVLFPIRLDEEVMATNKAWAADIRRTRHIGDFTCWKEHDAYQEALARLLRDLKASAQATG